MRRPQHWKIARQPGERLEDAFERCALIDVARAMQRRDRIAALRDAVCRGESGELAGRARAMRHTDGFVKFLADKAILRLDAPVVRVCNEDVPLPYAHNLEKAALVDTPRVIAAVKAITNRA